MDRSYIRRISAPAARPGFLADPLAAEVSPSSERRERREARACTKSILRWSRGEIYPDHLRRGFKRTRIHALEQGTSMNEVVPDFLDPYAGAEDDSRALRRFVEVGEGSGAGAGEAARGWSREDLYEERQRWPHS